MPELIPLTEVLRTKYTHGEFVSACSRGDICWIEIPCCRQAADLICANPFTAPECTSKSSPAVISSSCIDDRVKPTIVCVALSLTLSGPDIRNNREHQLCRTRPV